MVMVKGQQNFQTIRFMEPIERVMKGEEERREGKKKRSLRKGKEEHVLDRLFERMVERKREGQ